MKKLTTRAVNKALESEGLPVTLVSGGNYWYFIYDAGDVYETRSVLTPRLSDMSLETWISEGREFAGSVRKNLA